jgi:phage shock protein PspC (stress-responsive transcriptional regulator)
LIRKAMLLTLAGLARTIVCCLLLGLALYWELARTVAVLIFVASILSMLAGTGYYIAEINVALSSVRDEAKYHHLMDSREGEEHRHDWQHNL